MIRVSPESENGCEAPAEEKSDRVPYYLPSPSEIAAICAEIRAGWTAAERRRATTYRPMPWSVPQATLTDASSRRESLIEFAPERSAAKTQSSQP